MMTQPEIIIDHREHANELKDCLQEQYGFIVFVEHLELGDYSLAQTFRLPLLRTRNQKDSAWHLNQLYQQRQHLGEGTQPLYGYTPKTLNSRKFHVLSALPGIGPKMAKSLLDEFGSVTNIVTASESDLLKIYGLGPKTVKHIQDVLREPDPFYGRSDNMD